MSCLFYHRKAAAARVFREKFPEGGRGDENQRLLRTLETSGAAGKDGPVSPQDRPSFYSASIIVSWSAVYFVSLSTMSVIFATSSVWSPSSAAETTTLMLFSPIKATQSA